MATECCTVFLDICSDPLDCLLLFSLSRHVSYKDSDAHDTDISYGSLSLSHSHLPPTSLTVSLIHKLLNTPSLYYGHGLVII